MNAFLNAENFSQNDLQSLLFKPVNVFGYRFLVNIVTFLYLYNGLRYSSIELPDPGKPYHFIIIGGGTGDEKTGNDVVHNLFFKQLDLFWLLVYPNTSNFASS